jgi:hypothetical protein
MPIGDGNIWIVVGCTLGLLDLLLTIAIATATTAFLGFGRRARSSLPIPAFALARVHFNQHDGTRRCCPTHSCNVLGSTVAFLDLGRHQVEIGHQRTAMNSDHIDRDLERVIMDVLEELHILVPLVDWLLQLCQFLVSLQVLVDIIIKLVSLVVLAGIKRMFESVVCRTLSFFDHCRSFEMALWFACITGLLKRLD